MAQLVKQQTGTVYATSTINCDGPEGEVLVIARPPEGREASQSTSSTSFTSIHYRDTQPSIFYAIRGSQVVLTCLGTQCASTVLEFGSRVKNIGLADDSVNLIVHVFVESKVLYSMILQPANLEDPQLRKEDGWISEYSAPSFQIREPLYMHVLSATSIIFSLQDGGLLRLSNNGHGYNEHIFSDSSYFSSFKSILPWSGRPANLVISMVGSESRSILYTLSVDARLKVWDISKGRLIAVHDTFPSHRPPMFLSEPIESNFLALYEHSNGVMLVTYCPQRPGSFKVFRGKAGVLEEVFGFEEEQPQEGIWRVFDFVVSNVQADGTFQLHVLWKMDTLMKLQTAEVSLSSKQAKWQFAASHDIFDDIPNASIDSLEDFVFESSRFSKQTLHEAFESLTGKKQHLNDSTRAGLKDQIAQKIKSSVVLSTDEETGNALQDKYDEDLRLQYLNLAQICVELDRFSGEPQSLCKNSYSQEIFVAQSAKISVVRQACALEQLLQSVTSKDELGTTEAEVLRNALVLREGLGLDSWINIADTLRHTSLNDRTTSADDAMFLTFEKTTEHLISPALEAQLSAQEPSNEVLVKGLQGLMRYLQQSLSDKSLEGSLGAQTYIAEKCSIHKLSLDVGTVLLAYLIHTACSNDKFNVYHISTLFIAYLRIYRQNLLAFDSMTKYVESIDGQSRPSYTTAQNSAIPAKTSGSNLVLHEVLSMANGRLSSRDVLDKIIICLINIEQGPLAIHFCQCILDTPLSYYLRARSLLLNQEYTQAASLFVRVAIPLVNSAATKSAQHLLVKVERLDLVSFHLHVAQLFLAAGQANHAVRFCNEAELVSATTNKEMQHEVQEQKLTAALVCQDWSEAYNAIATGLLADYKDKIRLFATAVCEAGEAIILQKLPFIGIVDDVDAALERRARNMLDVRTKPSYHKILYGFRMRHGEYRGAAAILYHRLQFLRNRTLVSGFNMADHLEITEGYLAIINALRCLLPDDAWVIIGTVDQATQQHKRVKTREADHAEQDVYRKVLKLSDVRAEYNKELRNMEAQLLALREFDD